MVSTRKKRQSNRRLLSQFDDLDQDITFRNAASDKQPNGIFNEGTVDQEFTVNITGSNLTTNGNLVNGQTLQRCFYERIDREMGNINETVEDRIQNAILTALDDIITPRIELAVRSKNPSSREDATSVRTNSERGEQIGITAFFENVSERNYTLLEMCRNDDTGKKILDVVSELSVPVTHSGRQPHTHDKLFNGYGRFSLSFLKTHYNSERKKIDINSYDRPVACSARVFTTIVFTPNHRQVIKKISHIYTSHA